jgi:hypothetical protein
MLLAVLITGALAVINHDTYIIGGDYVVHEGNIVHGNLRLFFAQVTLEKDAHVEGAILSFSSTMDVRGTVTGNISSLESEVKVRESAHIKGIPSDTNILPLVLLLPEMARWNMSFGD